MPSHRHDRAASTLQREIARILAEEVRDPDAAEVRVSKVDLAPDKRSARVLLALWEPVQGEEPDPRPLQALVRATPFVRKTLARTLRMRHVPELKFQYDLGEQHAMRMDSLLERIRKRARKGAAVVLGAAALQFAAPDMAPAMERLESSAAIMGSEFRIACYADTKRQAAGAVTAAFDEVRRVDEFLSHYKPDSELSRINRGAGRGAVRISEEMAGLLEASLGYARASEGAFDITVGALVDAWGFYRGDGAKPKLWTLWWARRNSGFRHLDLDASQGTVRFLRSSLLLDPGGIGKGYAVDRAVAALREFGIEAALVSAGTSSIFALGEPPDSESGWDLDVRGTGSEGGIATTVRLKDEALSTSGSYEKFFEDGGKRYSHIIDPRTGQPSAGTLSVSVVAQRAIDAEAWSTALFVNGAAWAREHPVPGARVFFCAENQPCAWLSRD